jgi:hypothetical protein
MQRATQHTVVGLSSMRHRRQPAFLRHGTLDTEAHESISSSVVLYRQALCACVVCLNGCDITHLRSSACHFQSDCRQAWRCMRSPCSPHVHNLHPFVATHPLTPHIAATASSSRVQSRLCARSDPRSSSVSPQPPSRTHPPTNERVDPLDVHTTTHSLPHCQPTRTHHKHRLVTLASPTQTTDPDNRSRRMRMGMLSAGAMSLLAGVSL